MQLFLDCDGVLADYDKLAEQIAGCKSYMYQPRFPGDTFWTKVYEHPDFFYALEPMPDAHELVDAVRHLNPIILTGTPSKETQHTYGAASQKQRWREKHFPDLKMITCKSKDKYLHMHPGKRNIIVDDWDKFKHVWEKANGYWVLHTSAADSIKQLKQLNVI